jgi:hypothetical protein
MDSDQFATSAGTDRGVTSLAVAPTWYQRRELDDGVVLTIGPGEPPAD